MNGIVNLNSIRSDSCDCNKPKNTSCGCHNHNKPQPCHQAIDLSDLYFKVRNLFGELKSEWQRAEARSNLGITEIIDLKQIKIGEGSGDTNIWEMITSKGGSLKVYDFVVKNGEKGESATINIGEVFSLNSNELPSVHNVGTSAHAVLNFGIPKGLLGKSAYEIYVDHGGELSEEEWLDSLKGDLGFGIADIQLVDFVNTTKTIPGNRQITADMFIWKISLTDGNEVYVWVPFGGNNLPVPYGVPTFLYKKIQFDTSPSADMLLDLLELLQQEVNVNASTGKTVEELTLNENGWKTTAPVIRSQGLEFIYLASSVITEEGVGPWSVIQLTGTLGAQGTQGEPGEPGESGTSGQGLMGPVIRLRGTWQEDACYLNESTAAQNGTTIRFIDVVEYNGSYWMVNPACVYRTGEHQGEPRCAEGAPGLSLDWVEAASYDFAYINTLIANYLSTVTIDSEEIRIHSRKENANHTKSDIIVAGMTSGANVKNETNATNADSDPIRIWAGSNVDVLANSNGQYVLNIEGAKFKVRQSGKLEATEADIEGTIRANTLILEELNTISHEGTFILPTTNDVIILPNLKDDTIQLFYILTNLLNSNVMVSRSGNDDIRDMDGHVATSFSAAKNKLYQLFGVDNHWYVVELGLVAISSGGKTVDPSFYDFNLSVTLDDEINTSASTYALNGTAPLMPGGLVQLTVKNKYSENITIWYPNLYLTLNYLPESGAAEQTAYQLLIPGSKIELTKGSGTKTLVVGYGTKSGESTSNILGLAVEISSEPEDLAGYKLTFEFSSIVETDFAEIDGVTTNKINFNKAVAFASY